MTSLPVPRRAGERRPCPRRGATTRCAPVVGPSPGDDVDDAGRDPDLGRELAEAQGGQRRGRVGLQHDRAARGERGAELPGSHHDRVVPGDDLRADADRLLQRVEEERAADRMRAACDRRDRRGEEAEVLDRRRDLALRGGDRLADVARLELGELLAVRVDGVGERVEEPRALGRGRLAPRARRARRARPRPRGRRPRARPSRRGRAARRSPAPSDPRTSPEAGSTSSPLMKRPYSRSGCDRHAARTIADEPGARTRARHPAARWPRPRRAARRAAGLALADADAERREAVARRRGGEARGGA